MVTDSKSKGANDPEFTAPVLSTSDILTTQRLCRLSNGESRLFRLPVGVCLEHAAKDDKEFARACWENDLGGFSLKLSELEESGQECGGELIYFGQHGALLAQIPGDLNSTLIVFRRSKALAKVRRTATDRNGEGSGCH